MPFKNIEFNPKFTPTIEVTTKSGSVYQIDTIHQLFSGGPYEMPIEYSSFGAIAKNEPVPMKLQGFHPKAFDPTSINPEAGKSLCIRIQETVVRTSAIETIREIPAMELMQSGNKVVFQTRSDNEYCVDVEHNLISGGIFKDPVSFTEIGSCIGSGVGSKPAKFVGGVQNINLGKRLAAYIPETGWVITSSIKNIEHIATYENKYEQDAVYSR